MKFRNPGLLPLIIIAIAAGIGAGYVLPDWAARCFATYNSVFSAFLGFVIPLLIVAFVAPAIGELGRKAGKMLALTAGTAYLMTVAVGMLAYFVATTTFPSMLQADAYVASGTQAASEAPAPFFTMEIAPLMNVMTALVLAFVLGLGVAAIPGQSLRRGLDDFRSIIVLIINKVVIPGLPLYIFGIFLGMTVAGTVGPVLRTFAGIVAVIFVLHVGVLVLQYVLASAFSGLNPFKVLWTMLPAYFTALGTQSSAATIPVTLRQSVKAGVDPSVAGFVIPLCATIHMSGSTLKIVSCALALMITHGMDYSAGQFAGFVSMLAVTIIAAPGVPGGAIMASLGLLSSMLGFSEADNALMIALYIAMDSFGTACNITGDGAIAQIVQRLAGTGKSSPRSAEA